MKKLLMAFCLLGILNSTAYAQNRRMTSPPRYTPQNIPANYTVTIAPTVSSKDLNELACLTYIANKLGLDVSLEEILAASPKSADRSDVGFVPGWGVELSLIPQIAAEFGIQAKYVPGLSFSDATDLINKGNYVIYRTDDH